MPETRAVRTAAVLLALLASGILPASAQGGDTAKPLSPAEIERRIGGPTLVTLRFKDAPVRDVYEALARQAGIVWREAEPVWQKPPPRLNVDIQRQPFWTALNVLEQKTGIGLVRWGDEPDYGLGVRTGERTLLSGARSASGPFLLIAHRIERSESFSQLLGANAGEPRGQSRLRIGLLLFVDPKLRVGRVGSLRIEEAVDESGQSLLDENGRREQTLYAGPSLASEGAIEFSLPPKRGNRIRRLVGAIRLTAITESERWEIPLNAADAAVPEARKVLAERTFTVSVPPPGSGPVYEIELGYTAPPSPSPTGAGDVFTAIRLLDSEGREWRRSGGTVRGEGVGRYIFYGTFVRGNPDAPGAPGAPAKLIWDIPTERQQVEVPFAFNDLPIP